MQHLPSCNFCTKFGDEQGKVKRHPVFDRIILETQDFVVVPAIGTIVEGYVLIVTKSHVTGMAYLSKEILLRLEDLKSQLRQLLSRSFTAPMFFEHGLVGGDRRVGSCIEHAHLHCVPLTASLLPRLELLHNLRSISSFDDLLELSTKNESYLYLESQDLTRHVLTGVPIPSQYLRRLVAEEAGVPNQWDWAVWTFEKNARATLRQLGLI